MSNWINENVLREEQRAQHPTISFEISMASDPAYRIMAENDNSSQYTNGEDEELQLPADTMAILNEFLKEKEQRESKESTNSTYEFEEDWQLSQFWYNTMTKDSLAKVCHNLVAQRCHDTSSTDVKIALLSCPSLYSSVRKVHPHGTVRLFEFDQRFAAIGDNFVQYDYKAIADNTDYLNEFAKTFDILVVDPPFLSEECVRNTAAIVHKLQTENASIIMCTGAVVAPYVEQFLQLKQCKFHPEHERNLANEFCSYANFDLDALL